jgi:hypothetical protein
MLFTPYTNSLTNDYHRKHTVKVQIPELATISRHEEVPFLFSLPLERRIEYLSVTTTTK